MVMNFILAVAVIGLAVFIERFYTIVIKSKINGRAFIDRVVQLVRAGKIDDAIKLCAQSTAALPDMGLLILRSRTTSAIGAWPSRQVLLATAAVATAGVLLPVSPLAGPLLLHVLPGGFFPWLAGILLAYGMAAQLVKRVYLRRAHTWL